MEKERKIVFSFRINERHYEKIRQIAEKNHRSINSQLERVVGNYIFAYEDGNGEIDVGALFED